MRLTRGQRYRVRGTPYTIELHPWHAGYMIRCAETGAPLESRTRRQAAIDWCRTH